MRILVLNYEYPPIGGGGGFVTRDIFEQMASLGHKVSVVTSHFNGLKKEEEVNGVRISRVPVWSRGKREVASLPSMFTYLPAGVSRAIRLLRAEKFDVINTHFVVPTGPAGHVLARLFRLPHVLTVHGGDLFDPSKSLSPHRHSILTKPVRIMLNAADRVVAQSTDTKSNVYKYYRVARPIDIIPLGIKKPVFKPVRREEYGLAPDSVVFVAIGRLVKRKNVGDALTALASLNGRFPYTFLIIGDGPEKQAMEQKAKTLGLADRVRFMANVTDEVKFQVLSLADIYLSSAMHEGFGLVFLEAMEGGLPIICYDRGGQTDFLLDGRTGFLVEFGNRRGFAAKILQLVQDQNLRKRIAEYNRKLVRNFYIPACADKYLALFEETISERQE